MDPESVTRSEPWGADTDGFNTTVNLDCGHSFRLNIDLGNFGTVNPPKTGDWMACPWHSPVALHDTYGCAHKYKRDRRVTSVRRDAHA